MSAVAKVILGDILGVGYSIDPRVQGTISLSSGRPVPKSQVLFVLESALHTSNAVLVHDAGGYHIVPADDAVGSGRVDRAGDGRNPEPGYGISVVPLQHVSVQTITKLLESFAAKPGSIRADPTKNLLIVVGNGIERRTAVDTILSFDEDWMRGQSVGIFPVHSTQPEPLVAELEKILDSGEDGLSQHLVKLQPVSRLNAVLVVARKPELLRAAAKWISRLDSSAVASTGVKVYKVRYGDCVKIAKLLSCLVHRRRGKHARVGRQSNRARRGGDDFGRGARPNARAWRANAIAVWGVGRRRRIGRRRRTGWWRRIGRRGTGRRGTGRRRIGWRRTGWRRRIGRRRVGWRRRIGRRRRGPGRRIRRRRGRGDARVRAPKGPPRRLALAEVSAAVQGGGRALLPGVRIIPDVVNNSVVIYANAENYRIIERALNQLDRPQAQVAVDVTIAEVELNNTLNYGVQFFLGSINSLSHPPGVEAVNASWRRYR